MILSRELRQIGEPDEPRTMSSCIFERRRFQNSKVGENNSSAL